jgi:hypothetical protein
MEHMILFHPERMISMSESMKNQIREELEKLLPKIKKVTRLITVAEEDWTEHYDHTSPDDLYLRGMFYRIGDMLDDAGRLVGKTFAEVVEEGVLCKQSNERYSLHGNEFTSGSSLEYLAKGDDGDYWEHSRIEHNGHDYYLVADRDLPLEGLCVRIKHVRY